MNPRRRLPIRPGLSLLEVIIALAILGLSMAVLGELVRLGARNAAASRDLLIAQTHCESIMGELVAGVRPPEAVQSDQVVSLNPESQFVYRIEVETVDEAGILAVRVTVAQDLPPEARPVTYSLTRWMLDPLALQPATDSATSTTTGGL